MKSLVVGKTIVYGQNHSDMIERAIGIKGITQRSSASLKDFGIAEVYAWFVCMDGTERGLKKNWKWKNFLSDDGKEIKEKYTGDAKEIYEEKTYKEGFLPFRLAFQLDPYQNGNKHCCKFVGVFRFDGFYDKHLLIKRYVRVSESFTLGLIGEDVSSINNKSIFLKDFGKYYTPIEPFNLSVDLSNMLKKYGIKYMGELLELGLSDAKPSYLKEIREKLYDVFKC